MPISIMELIVIEDKQFQKILNDIREIKEALLNQGRISSTKKWITAIEVGDLLNIKIRTVYHYCKKGILNPHKVLGLLTFDREEVEALIKKN
jgi:hypothetical protein